MFHELLYETKHPTIEKFAATFTVQEKINTYIQAAHHMRDQGVITKTKNGYLSKLRVMKTFFLQNGFSNTLIGPNDELLIHESTGEDQKEALISIIVGLLLTRT